MWREQEWEELTYDREFLESYKRFVDAYIAVLEERGWLDDWYRWGSHSLSLYDIAKKLGVDLEALAKEVRWFQKHGLAYLTHYFIYSEPERKYSVEVPVDTLRRFCKVLFERVKKLARYSREAAERFKERYVPVVCFRLL